MLTHIDLKQIPPNNRANPYLFGMNKCLTRVPTLLLQMTAKKVVLCNERKWFEEKGCQL